MDDTPTKSVLLIGANYRAFFFVARKLHRLGFAIDVVDFEEIPFGSSNYIRVYKCVTPANSISDLKNAVVNLLNSSNYYAIIPINDVGLLFCNKYRDILEKHCKILMPSSNIIDFAIDKYKLISFSKKFGFDDANIQLITDKNNLTEKLINNTRKIIKTTNSRRITNGEIIAYSTYTSENQNDLIAHFNDTDYPIILQDYVEGAELGFNFYAKNGEIVCSYFDRNVINNFGEQSIIRETVPTQPDIEQRFKHLVKEIAWNGVGMFDLIINKNKVCILELNGRFWASIDLSEKIKSPIWENYIMDNFNLKSEIKTIKIHKATSINLISAIKKVVLDLIHFKADKKTMCVAGYLFKSVVSPSTYIQEKIISDFPFYFHLFCSYAKKILSK